MMPASSGAAAAREPFLGALQIWTGERRLARAKRAEAVSLFAAKRSAKFAERSGIVPVPGGLTDPIYVNTAVSPTT